MRIKYIFSAVALFLLFAFLGVWLCSLLLNRPTDSITALPPPMSVALPPSSQSTAGLGGGVDTAPSSLPDSASDVGFKISSDKLYPGEYLVIYAYGIEADDINISCPFSRKPQFFPYQDYLVALLPIKYTYEPGEYLLTAEGKGYKQEFTLHLLSKEWQTQDLTVDESITSETIDNSAANDEYFAKVQPKKNLYETSALWQGSFIQPVEGTITTEFGMLRTVNGVPSDRHGGVDISAKTGTPVLAANAGKVIFAKKIALTGNTVCIEHGLGLKSWYYHMDSINISENDIVEKAQKIGEVGSTGFSTGPHLHWATSVFDVYINPWSLVEASPSL